MSDLESSLQECFSTVFPDLPPDQIANAAIDVTPQWDSLATVTLVTVLEEDFGIAIDYDDFAKLTSYNAILEYLQSSKSSAVLDTQE